MSTVQDEIKAANAKHEAEVAALQKKAKAEQDALELKRKAELEDLAKNGRNNAIEALVSLADDGVYLIEDGPVNPFADDSDTEKKLYIVCGKERFEIEVQEEFESTSMWAKQSRGESRGFWYIIDPWRCRHNFVNKTRKWKKAATAHEKITELRDECMARQDWESKRRAQIDTAIKTLEDKYPLCGISKVRDNVVAVHPNKLEVIFSVLDGIPTLEKIDVRHVEMDDKELILGMLFSIEVAENIK